MAASLHVQLKVPLSSSSMMDQAQTLSALKPHIDALREAAGEGHEYSDKIKAERNGPAKPRKSRALVA